jgi:mRNA export factor
MFDVATGQAVQVAQHDAPIKNVRWVDAAGQGLLATGSWDKVSRAPTGRKDGTQLTRSRQTIKYWDLRAPNAVASVSLPERCYSALSELLRGTKLGRLTNLATISLQRWTSCILSWS